MKYEVLLTTGTVGVVTSEHQVDGELVIVKLHDENGINVSVAGVVAEVLNTYEDWE